MPLMRYIQRKQVCLQQSPKSVFAKRRIAEIVCTLTNKCLLKNWNIWSTHRNKDTFQNFQELIQELLRTLCLCTNFPGHENSKKIQDI